MCNVDLIHFEYLPMNKNSATSIDSISYESDCAWQVLADIFPGHVHDIDDFVSNFLNKQRYREISE